MDRVGGYTAGCGEKIGIFWQKYVPTRYFYAWVYPFSQLLDVDRWVQHEGYKEPDLGEKHFQKFVFFMV